MELGGASIRFLRSRQEQETDIPVDRHRIKLLIMTQEIIRYIRGHLEDREALKLSAMSRHFGLSPFHFQRTFREAMGVTPRQYAEALRIETLKEDLRTEATVTDAIYSAGFGSSSRVYGRAGKTLGMTPKQYRAGGATVEISYATSGTALGLVMIGATNAGLCFLQFGESEEELLAELNREFPKAVIMAMEEPHPLEFTQWMLGLNAFLGSERPQVSLYGTAFQMKVWRYLQTIPAGSVQSYKEVAEGIGHPKAVRAVASACAANRVAVLVPCHRVIRGDGGLGGYRWGLERKRALIESERRTGLG